MGFITFPASIAGDASINIPQGVAPSSPIDGDQWYDQTQKTYEISLNGITYKFTGIVGAVTLAPAALTSLNGTGTFATIVLPTAFMNVAGKALRIRMFGIYTTISGQTPTIGIQTAFSGAYSQTVATSTSQATSSLESNFPWDYDGMIYCVTPGASGTLEGHGRLSILLGASGSAPESVYQDTNTTPGSAVNLAAAGVNNLLLQAVTSGTLSSIQMRGGFVEALN